MDDELMDYMSFVVGDEECMWIDQQPLPQLPEYTDDGNNGDGGDNNGDGNNGDGNNNGGNNNGDGNNNGGENDKAPVKKRRGNWSNILTNTGRAGYRYTSNPKDCLMYGYILVAEYIATRDMFKCVLSLNDLAKKFKNEMKILHKGDHVTIICSPVYYNYVNNNISQIENIQYPCPLKRIREKKPTKKAEGDGCSEDASKKVSSVKGNNEGEKCGAVEAVGKEKTVNDGNGEVEERGVNACANGGDGESKETNGGDVKSNDTSEKALKEGGIEKDIAVVVKKEEKDDVVVIVDKDDDDDDGSGPKEEEKENGKEKREENEEGKDGANKVEEGTGQAQPAEKIVKPKKHINKPKKFENETMEMTIARRNLEEETSVWLIVKDSKGRQRLWRRRVDLILTALSYQVTKRIFVNFTQRVFTSECPRLGSNDPGPLQELFRTELAPDCTLWIGNQLCSDVTDFGTCNLEELTSNSFSDYQFVDDGYEWPL